MIQKLLPKSLLSLSLSLIPVWAGALPTDQQQPMHISSDASNIERDKGIATFTGHVQFEQGSLKVLGDKMVVFFDKNNQMQKAIVTADAGNLAEAWTQPQADKPVLHVKAQVINYNAAIHTIDLIGNAQADQNGNVLKGPSLTYNTQTQVLTTIASQTGRTTIVIQPQKNKTETTTTTTTTNTNTKANP